MCRAVLPLGAVLTYQPCGALFWGCIIEWTKIKVKHFLFSSLSDAQLGQLAKILCLVATLEKIPTGKELRKICTQKRQEKLENHFKTEGKSLVFVMQKVLEDVNIVVHKRKVSRETSERYRNKQGKSDTSLDTTEKRREDKRREDKRIIYTTVENFFEHFKTTTKQPKLKLTKDKIALVKTRLNDGYTIDDLKKATGNFIKDTWDDRKKYMDLVYCIGKQKGKGDNLEKWLNYENDKKEDKPRLMETIKREGVNYEDNS